MKKIVTPIANFGCTLALLLMTWSCDKNSTEYIRTAPVTIQIGALISLTGTGSSTGESSEVALNLARENVEEQLNTLGYRVSVQLVIEDTQTDTAVALQKLVTLFSRGIRLVIGPYSSAEVAHLKSFVDRNGMLLVSPSSVATSLAIPGDNIFRFVTSDVVQAEAMTKLLSDDGVRVVVPVIRDDVWGRDLLQALADDFRTTGGELHEPVKYNPAITDFTSFLEQLDANVASEWTQYPQDEIVVYLASFGEGTLLLKDAGDFSNLSGTASRWLLDDRPMSMP